MIAVLVIGGVLLLAMIGVSCYGWVTLPADARVPIHFGAGYNNFVSKRLGLIMHPAAGVLLYVISALTTHHSSKSSPAFILPLLMCVLLAVQIGAIKVARTNTARPSKGPSDRVGHRERCLVRSVPGPLRAIDAAEPRPAVTGRGSPP
jgi:hypothetical protein